MAQVPLRMEETFRRMGVLPIVQTAKTVGPVVRVCPFASMVPTIGGLIIGGPWDPV